MSVFLKVFLFCGNVILVLQRLLLVVLYILKLALVCLSCKFYFVLFIYIFLIIQLFMFYSCLILFVVIEQNM